MTRRPLLAGGILGTASSIPGPLVTTETVAARAGISDAAELVRRTGIRSRAWAPAGVRASTLGAQVLRDALGAAGLTPRALRRVIFVSSTGAEELIPATATIIAAEAGVGPGHDCFDVNNACVGFLSALDLAYRSVATGLGPVAVVVVELLSRYLTPADPRPYAVLGDGAAAVIVGANTTAAHGREQSPRPPPAGSTGWPERPDPGEAGVLATHLRTDASAPRAVALAHPGVTGERETIRFAESNQRISETTLALLGEATEVVLRDGGLSLAEVEWILPHQPNGRLVESITRTLGLDPARIVPIAPELGSLGAASIPVSLDRLARSGRLAAGQHLLMMSIGGGVSYGATLLRIGAPPGVHPTQPGSPHHEVDAK